MVDRWSKLAKTRQMNHALLISIIRACPSSIEGYMHPIRLNASSTQLPHSLSMSFGELVFQKSATTPLTSVGLNALEGVPLFCLFLLEPSRYAILG